MKIVLFDTFYASLTTCLGWFIKVLVVCARRIEWKLLVCREEIYTFGLLRLCAVARSTISAILWRERFQTTSGNYSLEAFFLCMFFSHLPRGVQRGFGRHTLNEKKKATTTKPVVPVEPVIQSMAVTSLLFCFVVGSGVWQRMEGSDVHFSVFCGFPGRMCW